MKNYCEACEGIGVTREQVDEKIYLPNGLKDGQKIRIHHLGHASDVHSSVAGDLLLTVKVKDHDHFKVKERDILTTVPITLTQAILGDKITIDTVDGKLNIEIPEGT